MTRFVISLNKYLHLLLVLSLGASLVFFVPNISDKFGLAKNLLTILMLLLLCLGIFVLTLTNIRHKLVLSRSSLFLISSFLVLSISLLVSFTQSKNQIESFWADTSSIGFAFWGIFLALILAALFLTFENGEKYAMKFVISTLLFVVTAKSLIFLVAYLFTADGLLKLKPFLDLSTHAPLALAVVGLSFGMLIRSKWWINLIGAFSLSINLGFLTIASPQFHAAGLIILLGVVVSLAVKHKLHLSQSLILGLAIVVLAILAKTFLVSNASLVQNYLPKVPDPINSLTSSLSVISDEGKSLIFGAGIGNFASEFSKARPASLNATADWQESYVQPGSEISRTIIELGLFGLVSTLLIIVGGGFFASKAELQPIQTQENSSVISDTSGKVMFFATRLMVVSITISYFFSAWDTSVLLIFALGLSLVTARSITAVTLPGWTGLILPGIALLFVGLISLLKLVPADPISQIVNYYRAESLYQLALDGIQKNDARNAYDHLAQARQIIPDKAKYREQFALLSLTIGESVYSSTKGVETNVEQLFAQAISEIKVATEALSPDSIAYWITRVNIYTKLESKYANTVDQTILSYDKLISLSPTQPLFRMQQGLKLFANNEYVRATQRFSEAIALKPDYYAAYVARARSFKAEGKTEEAKQDLLNVSEKLAITDPLYQQAADELKNLVTP